MRYQDEKMDWFDYLTAAVVLLCTLSFILVLTGCNTTSFQSVRPDGTYIKVSNQRFFWQTELYALTLSSNSASLKATKANASSDAMGAVAEGVARGIVNAAH